MSKDNDFLHHIGCSDKFKKKADRIAALLELDSWYDALVKAVDLTVACAEAYVKGDTALIACKPAVEALIKSNPEFIKALCEEGVVEWLTPFVLAKSRQGNQLTPDTNQP
jgi:hypothetical protein